MKNIINRLLCFIFFHRLEIIDRFGLNSYKLYCTRCKKYFGLNINIKAFLPWDNELEELRLFIKGCGS